VAQDLRGQDIWNSYSQKFKTELGLVLHTCNPSTWETEAGALAM
jgi:hypothetical protein